MTQIETYKELLEIRQWLALCNACTFFVAALFVYKHTDKDMANKVYALSLIGMAVNNLYFFFF